MSVLRELKRVADIAPPVEEALRIRCAAMVMLCVRVVCDMGAVLRQLKRCSKAMLRCEDAMRMFCSQLVCNDVDIGLQQHRNGHTQWALGLCSNGLLCLTEEHRAETTLHMPNSFHEGCTLRALGCCHLLNCATI